MFTVHYRYSPRKVFEKLPGQWYDAQDAAKYADALQHVLYQAQVNDEKGRLIYDAVNGEWMQLTSTPSSDL